MQTYNKSHGVAESFSIVPSNVKPYIVVNQRLEERLLLWQWNGMYIWTTLWQRLVNYPLNHRWFHSYRHHYSSNDNKSITSLSLQCHLPEPRTQLLF
jgi:hypothetical protein